jgi:hypothetical protein
MRVLIRGLSRERKRRENGRSTNMCKNTKGLRMADHHPHGLCQTLPTAVHFDNEKAPQAAQVKVGLHAGVRSIRWGMDR